MSDAYRINIPTQIPPLRYTDHASVGPPTLEVTNRARTMLFGDTLGRRAQMVEQGIADAQGAFAPAMEPMRGCRIPKITHIRACGVHVCRMEKCTLRGVRQCGIRRRTCRSAEGGLSVRTYTENFCCSYPDEAREDMGRYQGTPGGSVILYIHPSHALRPEDRRESLLR